MRLRKLAVLLLPVTLAAQTHSQSCEADGQTIEQLRQVDAVKSENGDRKALQLKFLDELLAQSPGNPDLHLRYQQIAGRGPGNGRQEMIARYQQLAAAHPGSAEYQYFYASALIDVDTPQAIRIANALLQSAPDFPRTHLLLANIYGWGKFADKPKAESETMAYFDQCPASLNHAALYSTTEIRTPDLCIKLARQLRERLQKETDPVQLENWRTVWDLEFKASSPAQHDRVRKQIAVDLAALSEAYPNGNARWLVFLKDAYKLAGDPAASQKEEQKLLAEFPKSEQARRISSERWYKQHPWPGSDPEKLKAYRQASLQRADEQLKLSPDSVEYLWSRFSALSGMDETPNSQLTAAADAFLAQYAKSQNMMFSPPPQLQIAKAFVKHKIRIEQIPSLVQQGSEASRAFNGPPSDRSPEDATKSHAEFENYLAFESASVLIDAARELGKPEIAQAAITKVESLKPEKPFQKGAQLQAEAKWAELQNRKLDALLFYRAALDTRAAGFKPPEKDELAENVARLRKELGGTAASQALWDARRQVTQTAEDGTWTKPVRDMKPWQLTDLAGKTWKLTQFEGKVTLINVWATWCGPCQAEHPHLEKLYSRLKNDPNIQIVTFNVDEEIGSVEPYMKEHAYTFPVLLASDYVNDMLQSLSIPRNWIVDSKGKWQWEQIGFGDPEKWQSEIAARLRTSQ
jgi:thiol-disulfide isomerase/thioredoxin